MTWEWLAGFTDGDGCITVSIGTALRIRWTQKESEAWVLDEIVHFLEAEGVFKKSSYYSVTTQGHVYQQAELSVGAQNEVRQVLEGLLPHLILKHETAKAGLAHLDYVDNERLLHGRYYRKRNSGGWAKGEVRDQLDRKEAD